MCTRPFYTRLIHCPMSLMSVFFYLARQCVRARVREWGPLYIFFPRCMKILHSHISWTGATSLFYANVPHGSRNKTAHPSNITGREEDAERADERGLQTRLVAAVEEKFHECKWSHSRTAVIFPDPAQDVNHCESRRIWPDDPAEQRPFSLQSHFWNPEFFMRAIHNWQQ